MLLQNFGSFFLVSNVWLALLAPVIGKWTAAPMKEPVNQIEESKSGKNSTEDFQDFKFHFPICPVRVVKLDYVVSKSGTSDLLILCTL